MPVPKKNRLQGMTCPGCPCAFPLIIETACWMLWGSSFASGHENLLPVSMVASSVYIQGKWLNAPRHLFQGMSISISRPLAMLMPRLYVSFLLVLFGWGLIVIVWHWLCCRKDVGVTMFSNWHSIRHRIAISHRASHTISPGQCNIAMWYHFTSISHALHCNIL